MPATYAPDALHAICEPTLFYDPPYERPLEDEFAWHLMKYLTPSSALGYQVEAETPAGRFWIDFVVESAGRKVGFEIGDLTEEPDAVLESIRDALLVGSGCVDALYRLRGEDVLHRLHDCLALVAKWEPVLFSLRGHINLSTLASPEAAAVVPKAAAHMACLHYNPPGSEGLDGEAFTWPVLGEPEDLVVRRFDRAHPAAWMAYYDRALIHFGVAPDVLTEFVEARR